MDRISTPFHVRWNIRFCAHHENILLIVSGEKAGAQHCAPASAARTRLKNQSFILFNSSEFVTTDTELNAIAVPAMIGFKKPNAAKGMPTLL